MWSRANEARRPDSLIDDPMAIQVLDSIDYDFSGFPASPRQDVALRALSFDTCAHRYLSSHPQATVVALGEGLQTSFWRLNAAGLGDEFRWLTVDLTPIIEMRQQLLPHSPRVSMCAQSALDFSWMDQVDPQHGVFVSAEGLLMYLEPEQALGLIRECAHRFPGGQMMFDLPSKLYSNQAFRRIRALLGRTPWPLTPFSLSVRELAGLPDIVPGVRSVSDLPLPRGRGAALRLLWSVRGFPVVSYPIRRVVGIKWPTIATLTLLEFNS
ncbi:class I SAM-dependent methyltransferase [Mycolicibacterium sphagni]|uniref:Methyltransferase n=1 Tax=Mycolicibacterium sphagni TaxID=1786 RepID=A0A255D5H3_9MYCO|nr:class I SAM-dependent methyltransferase [Mycolicibacterium sphagni]OYN74364.1 methyltransferase [Mycolicibacterium sphagni]